MADKQEPLVRFDRKGKDIHVATVLSDSVVNPLNVSEFSKEVSAYAKQHPALVLILNFERVDYLSSSVLSELLQIRKVVIESGGQLRLCAISDTIYEIFEITNLNTMFTIHRDGVDADIKRYERAKAVAEQESAWSE